MFVHLLAQRGEDFFGGAHAQVRAEQRGFELLQQLGIDGAVARENCSTRAASSVRVFRDGLFQPLEKRRFGLAKEEIMKLRFRQHLSGKPNWPL